MRLYPAIFPTTETLLPLSTAQPCTFSLSSFPAPCFHLSLTSEVERRVVTAASFNYLSAILDSDYDRLFNIPFSPISIS